MQETKMFDKVFKNSVAKILDQCFFVGNMEQTISMLAESTDLSYKTVEKTIEHLEHLGMVKKTRKIGNAQAYQFAVDNVIGYFHHIGEP